MSIPKTMKAAVLFDFGDLRVTEVAVPALGVGEALIKVHSVAICGSDPAIIAKGWKGYPKLGEFIPGHEFTGTVVALAPDVTEFMPRRPWSQLVAYPNASASPPPLYKGGESIRSSPQQNPYPGTTCF